MDKHRGAILEMIVRKSPYSIKALAEKLAISRTTLYNKFKEQDLNYDFLLLVSKTLHHDLTVEIPELQSQVLVPNKQYDALARSFEKSYIQLLERYKRLFAFLTKLAHTYGLEEVKKKMNKITENKL